ncbi:MAG: LPS-assembly protein LptD [Burkholderiales bacterium]|nr:LPS-assembly protein LptD [Burkholderiales bacterium]
MRLSLREALVSQPCPRTKLSPVALVVCAALGSGAWAQPMPAESDVGLNLRPSSLLQEEIPAEQRDAAPVFLQGEHLSGRTDLETVIEGEATFRKAGTTIKADRLEYDQPTDQARASGNVRINRGGNVYEGPLLELKVERFEGFFSQPRYQFLQNDAHGEADRVDFIDEDHAVIHNASYTTCKRLPGPGWMPDWILRATTITLDNAAEEGVADGAMLSFKGVPVLPVPAISFPLTDKRKSGLLPPTIGVDNVNGAEVVAPYYWNIAPNRDATITPTLMTLRGVDMGGEFRYLEPGYSGTVRANYMPTDKLRGADRWGLAYLHNGTISTGVDAIGNVGLSVNLNRVSDDDYWRDFTRSSATLTQRLLPSDVLAGWGRGAVSASARFLRWQTLQDPTAPIVPPYDRVPQLAARYALANVRGFDFSVDGDFTQFEADRFKTLQPNTQRTFTQLQLSRPWLAPAGFISPKLQLHAATYQFDALLPNGSNTADSVVPTFSLDSGLVLERETSLWGRSMVQTLEPRAFYVYTPYRNQAALPNYDTGANDFNFATIFTENAFVGHDKISDNNLLTLGLTTRYLDEQTGAQIARFGVAQRLRFEDQQVTLNSAAAPALAGFSDVLMGASLNVSDRWALDSTVQYNAKTDQSVRSTIGARYNPGNYRVINTAYRFQRDVSEQLDMSWQWPLNDLWGDRGQDLGRGRGQGSGRYYSVGRMNYSLNEGRLVDTVLGVEYDAGCWLGRLVFERVQTSTSSATERLMFQLEFVGFTRLGIDPRRTLTQNISRYQNLRDTGGSNSRFGNYD